MTYKTCFSENLTLYDQTTIVQRRGRKHYGAKGLEGWGLGRFG